MYIFVQFLVQGIHFVGTEFENMTIIMVCFHIYIIITAITEFILKIEEAKNS